MKEIARTADDGYIVELTKGEHNGLAQLLRAAAGEPPSWNYDTTMPPYTSRGHDLADVFGAIAAWVEGHLGMKKMEERLSALNAAPEPPEDCADS